MYRFFSLFAAVSFFLLLLIFPRSAMEGAEKGLMLWYQKVLPVLLPFALASHLLLETNIMGRIKGQWYVMLTGFFCGYPMGALSTGILVQKGKISASDGRRLILFCNQPSPMFLHGFLGLQCLGLTKTFPLLAAAYLPPIALGWILHRGRHARSAGDHPAASSLPHHEESFHPLTIRHFERAWWESCQTLVKVGGYLLFFSILAAWIHLLIPPEQLEGLLLIGILEMTTGSALLAQSPLSLPLRAAIGLFLVSFGGLSCLAQTAGCLPKEAFDVRRYVLCKLFCGLSSAVLAYFLLSFPR